MGNRGVISNYTYAMNIFHIFGPLKQEECVVSSDLMDTWRGKAVEQIVAQKLKTYSFDVDVKRIEVKSGHNVWLKSLHQFMDEISHNIAVRREIQQDTVLFPLGNFV